MGSPPPHQPLDFTAQLTALCDGARASHALKKAMARIEHGGVPVFLARNAWDLPTTIEEWPDIRFKDTREQS